MSDNDLIIEKYFIQYRNQPRIFTVYNNISLTQRKNKIGYSSVKKILKKLNYESYFDGNKQKLRKIIK